MVVHRTNTGSRESNTAIWQLRPSCLAHCKRRQDFTEDWLDDDTGGLADRVTGGRHTDEEGHEAMTSESGVHASKANVLVR